MSSKLLPTKVDDLLRDDHYYVRAEDHCFFVREYTARKGFDFSDTNQRIFKPEEADGPSRQAGVALQGRGDSPVCEGARGGGSRPTGTWTAGFSSRLRLPRRRHTPSTTIVSCRSQTRSGKLVRCRSVTSSKILRTGKPSTRAQQSGDVPAKIANLRFNRAALTKVPQKG